MKTRKDILAVILCVLTVAILPAASYDSILSDAKENSTQLENSRISHENAMIGLSAKDRPEEPVWSVSGSVSPYREVGDNSDLAVTSLEASVTLPNDGKTRITVKAPFSIGYTDGYFTADPAVNAHHTFTFGAYDDSTLQDMQDAKSHLSAEAGLTRAELSYERNVISMMKQFISNERSIRQSERTLAERNRTVANMETLKTASKDSINYMKADLDRSKAERDLENLHTQRAMLEAQWKALTGLEWTGVEDIPEANLELVLHENGNTDVIMKSLDVEIASQNIEKTKSQDNIQKLDLNGGISASINAGDRSSFSSMGVPVKAKNSYGAKIGLTYSAGDSWNVGGTLNAGFDDRFKPSVPSFTISGSWTSDRTRDSKDDNLKKLENNLITATNNYNDGLISYTNDGMALMNDISNYQYKLEKTKADTEYQRRVLELEKLSFEKGLSSQKDLDKAQFDYDMREYEEKLVLLEGLELENRIRSYGI